MKRALGAWAVFVGGVAALIVADAFVRWRQGTFGESGLPTPDIIWFGTPFLLGGVAIFLLWQSTSRVQPVWLRLVVVGLQALVGFVLYTIACFMYVLGTGIDSM